MKEKEQLGWQIGCYSLQNCVSKMSAWLFFSAADKTQQ